MNTYKVTGLYTISFEIEVKADSREEAEEMAYELDIRTEWNGNSVFVGSGDAELCADGTVFDVDVKLINGEEDEED